MPKEVITSSSNHSQIPTFSSRPGGLALAQAYRVTPLLRAHARVPLPAGPQAAGTLLKRLAREHADSGVRFNAIQLLDDAGQFSKADAERFLSTERDPDTRELLHDLSK